METARHDSIDFFLGATTPAGFKGYFEPLRHEPGMQMYLIKSGPGCGKSTLMNALVGERLSIITSKAQTTRHRILGIVSDSDFQIVFSDTPGILRPNYKLQESMMRSVSGAVSDADVILYVTDTVEKDNERSGEIIGRILSSGIPTIVVINKIDLAPYVGASLEVMERDSRKMRGDRPFQFTNIRGDENVDKVVEWIKKNVLLEGM